MKDDDHRRRNIRKALQVWMAMPPEQRKRRWIAKDTVPDWEPEPLPPPRRQRQSRQAFAGEAMAYYRRHHAGLTRGQLHDQDPRFYGYLHRHGLLGLIPLKPRVSFPDPLAYYREHCAGMTRKQTGRAEPQFYSYLQRHGLLGTIPFAPATAGGSADRDGRQPEMPPAISPQRPETKPAGQRRRRQPSVAAARLECFRVIPE